MRPSESAKNFGNFKAEVIFPFSSTIVHTSFPSLRLRPVTYVDKITQNFINHVQHEKQHF